MGDVAKASLFRESLVCLKLMEIYENPACYEGARAFYEVGVGGEGWKGADRRQRRREGRSRSPKTSHRLSFKRRSRMTKVCFHPGLGKGTETQSLYNIRTHTPACTHARTQFSESASLSSNLCKLKVWPEKAFMCNMCNKEVCGWVGCCLNWELMRGAGWGRK